MERTLSLDLYRAVNPTPIIRQCVVCGADLPEIKIRRHAKYCGPKCQHKLAYTPEVPYQKLPPGSVGAAAELLVSSDLLYRGYEVFRSVSPSASCDLAIMKNGKLYRIEVRSGTRLVSGKLYYANNTKKDVGRQDIYAVVVNRTNEIVYSPELPGA